MHVAGGGGDGDAGGQRGDGGGADHADRDGEGVAVRDPGGGADGGGGCRDRHRGVARRAPRDHRVGVRRLSAPELQPDQEPADASGPAGGPEVLPVVPEAHRAQRNEVGVFRAAASPPQPNWGRNRRGCSDTPSDEET